MAPVSLWRSCRARPVSVFYGVGPPPARAGGLAPPPCTRRQEGLDPRTPRAKGMSVLHRSISAVRQVPRPSINPNNPAAQRRAATLAGTWQQPAMGANAAKQFPPAKAGSRVSPTTSRAPDAARPYGNEPLTPTPGEAAPAINKTPSQRGIAFTSPPPDRQAPGSVRAK